MPAKRGKPKADAGQYQRSKDVVTAPKVEGVRPSLPEVVPLFATYDVPKPADAYFDAEAADGVVNWIETTLRHYQGRWAGAPFLLMAWQIRLVREVFGWMRADGTRLYRTVYVEAPRKSGKSSLASAIALYLAHGDDEAAPQVFFAAFDKDQAAVCYQAARFMTEAAPELRRASAIYNSKKEMLLRDNPGGILKCLSSDSAKQYGLNLHGLIFDELMTQKTRDQWDALTTSQGSREQPLTFCISTAGWDQESICFEQHSHTEALVEGTVEDPSFLGVIFGADMNADWMDEQVWINANPSLGETVKLDYYRAAAAKAKSIPAEQNAFRTLFLSQWVGQETRLIPMEAWDRCKAKMKPPTKRVAFGGLDLASTTDLTAFVCVAEDAGTLDVYPWIFLPSEGLRERERRDRVPYSAWARDGLLTLTPGATTDYAYVKKAIHEAAEMFELRDIGYDRWGATQLVTELTEDGLTMVQMGQGFASMSAPTKTLLRLTMEGKLRHGANPLLRWQANNVAGRTDPAGNLKPDKERSTAKIDGIVAMIMAIDGWQRRGRTVKRRSVYESRSLLLA